MIRKIFPFLVRASITGLAFWWIFRAIDLEKLRTSLSTTRLDWLLLGTFLFLIAQIGCVLRWRLLAPRNPGVTLAFLTDSYLVGSFFNAFLPTTVGGDVVRGYDLIKATGEWRGSLASILMDRLSGLVALATFALMAWLAFPGARTYSLVRLGFFGFLLVVFATFGFLGSRRTLNLSLRPFGKIGLGQLQAHAKQFQESLLAFLKRPFTLLGAYGISLGIQALGIGMVAAVARSLEIAAPLFFIAIAVPIIVTISQLPLSLNGLGIREGATILLFGQVGVGREEALSLSLIGAAIPLVSGIIGGILFAFRRRRKRR